DFVAANHYQDLIVTRLAADSSGIYADGTLNTVNGALADLDPGHPGQTLLNPANGTGFVMRLGSGLGLNGLGLTWVKQAAVNPSGITLASGQVYVAGDFTGTVDFDPGPGVSNLTSSGGKDIFVWSLSSTGNLGWAKHMGGAGDDTGVYNGVA